MVTINSVGCFHRNEGNIPMNFSASCLSLPKYSLKRILWRMVLTTAIVFIPILQPLLAHAQNNNRIDGYCYDAAGNLLDAGPAQRTATMSSPMMGKSG